MLNKTFSVVPLRMLLLIGSAALCFSFQPRIPNRTPNLVLREKRTAPSEVTSMFDDFADTFEQKLISELNYVAPFEIAATIAKRQNETATTDSAPKLYQSALDAGCGTGLMGIGLRSLVKGPLVGVDLSPKMLELAGELVLDTEGISEKGIRRCTKETKDALGNTHSIYDGVFVADLLDIDGTAKFIDSGVKSPTKVIPDTVDLITSADVLCYFVSSFKHTLILQFSHHFLLPKPCLYLASISSRKYILTILLCLKIVIF